MTRKFQVWNYSEPYYQMYPDTWVCTNYNLSIGFSVLDYFRMFKKT